MVLLALGTGVVHCAVNAMTELVAIVRKAEDMVMKGKAALMN